jgi:CheY-like chemotaxis protein
VNGNTNNGCASERLTAIVVSADWFSRTLLRSAAVETGVFRHVVEADDGYTALAETWQCVEDGAAPDVIVIDMQAADVSAARLVMELRAAPETRGTLVGLVGMPEIDVDVAVKEVDFCTSCGVLHESLADIMCDLASRSLGAPPSRR